MKRNQFKGICNPRFDDIRPYYDDEIPAAMERIARSDVFPRLAAYVYPGQPVEAVRERILAYRTIHEVQHDTMYHVNEQVISRSITHLTTDGIQHLDPQRQYLYVSNHRDIMLDACLLQYILVRNGFETTEITFGANLMQHPVVIDVGRANKMFRVERPGGDLRQFYRSSRHLSEYIRWCIREKGESVWIAQRNGRTKDGRDATDQGLIKMLCMSEPQDRVKALAELNIVPVAISYEWEPCDVLKALELCQSQYARYVKKPGEDLNSILTGLLQPKGRVHIQLCHPLEEADFTAFAGLSNSEYHKAVAELTDGRIKAAYRLWPNNFIAHDMLYGNTRYGKHYTDGQYAAFCAHLSESLTTGPSPIGEGSDYTRPGLHRPGQWTGIANSLERERLREIFLGIYANPVESLTGELPHPCASPTGDGSY